MKIRSPAQTTKQFAMRSGALLDLSVKTAGAGGQVAAYAAYPRKGRWADSVGTKARKEGTSELDKFGDAPVALFPPAEAIVHAGAEDVVLQRNSVGRQGRGAAGAATLRTTVALSPALVRPMSSVEAMRQILTVGRLRSKRERT